MLPRNLILSCSWRRKQVFSLIVVTLCCLSPLFVVDNSSATPTIFHELGHRDHDGHKLRLYVIYHARERLECDCDRVTAQWPAPMMPLLRIQTTVTRRYQQAQTNFSRWAPRRAPTGKTLVVAFYAYALYGRRTYNTVCFCGNPHVVAILALLRRAARQWWCTMLAKLRLFQSKYVFQRGSLLFPLVSVSHPLLLYIYIRALSVTLSVHISFLLGGRGPAFSVLVIAIDHLRPSCIGWPQTAAVFSVIADRRSADFRFLREAREGLR